ncbi:hypothetical protein ACQR35_09390 [Pseudarthrobacter sp. J1738]|uniref:hypothetical protein n=1 Tax=unclassified Pseudarthrobacter TaxID=2647000 RepID=UPI003D2AF4AC
MDIRKLGPLARPALHPTEGSVSRRQKNRRRAAAVVAGAALLLSAVPALAYPAQATPEGQVATQTPTTASPIKAVTQKFPWTPPGHH